MADRTQLGQAAVQRQQVFYMDPMLAWEQRLALAHDEAAAHIQAALPPGTVLDLASYELAADMAGNQLSTHSDSWLNSFNTDKDAPVASGLKFESQNSRDYYLGHYAKAKANLGAFITGYAREQISLGALSEADFNQACDLRLRALSDIIYLGRTGQLQPLVDAKGWRDQVAPSDSSIVIAKSGTATGQDAQALGVVPYVPIAIGIIIVSAVVAAGIGAAWYLTNENNKQRRIALEICQDAVKRGHKDAKAICENLEKETDKSLLDQFISQELQDTITYAVVGGVGIMLLINFAPNIIESLGRSRQAYSDVQARRLKWLQEQST